MSVDSPEHKLADSAFHSHKGKIKVGAVTKTQDVSTESEVDEN